MAGRLRLTAFLRFGDKGGTKAMLPGLWFYIESEAFST